MILVFFTFIKTVHLVTVYEEFGFFVKMLEVCTVALFPFILSFMSFSLLFTVMYCIMGVEIVEDLEYAQALIDLVHSPRDPSKRIHAKFNLIPFNPFPESGLTRSNAARVNAFADVLSKAGIVTTVRKTRGDDIDAACGQLAGDVKDCTQVQSRMAKQKVIPLKQVSL